MKQGVLLFLFNTHNETEAKMAFIFDKESNLLVGAAAPTTTNGTQEFCNEGEAIYFMMNEEKARGMGFLHCEVESDGE